MSRKLRPTLSRDGIDRADLLVRHRISRYDVIELLLDRLDAITEGAMGTGNADLPEWSAKRVMDELRCHVVLDGSQSVVNWSDTVNDAVRAWAERHAAKVWPAEATSGATS